MKNADSQIILYAKSWFKRTEVVQDLSKLISVRNGVDIKWYNKKNISGILLSIVEEYIPVNRLKDIIIDLDPTNSLGILKRQDRLYDFHVALIEACLSQLSILQTKEIVDDKFVDLIELDEPDYSILPKRKYL